MPVVDEEVAESETAGSRTRGNFLRYLGLLATLLLVAYLAGFVMVRLPSYERWGGSAYGPILDYAFQTAGQNADVVIFGDSSALFAVDPLQMSRETGLKVINLPNTIGGLPVIGDMALQRYMATNRPPRLIVFYFCSWDLDYANAKGTKLFEGEEMLVRHGSWAQIGHFALHHPHEVFSFPFRVYSSLAPGSLLHLLRPGGAAPEVVAFRGHVANLLPYGSLRDDCSIPANDLQEQHAASVRNLMMRYAGGHTKTMLYIAPVPGCKNVDALRASVRTNLGVAPPPVFPAIDFNADSYYAHLKPNAVGQATQLAGAAVRAELQAR